MPTLAIITARGGSKRVPGKNIKEFCGKPIIAYSIEAALKSKVFDEVMVSTDSEEIAVVAQRYGAAVPFLRSAATSSDTATTTDVLREVLCEYVNLGRRYEVFSCIYPTAPFITAEKLRDAAERFYNSDADSLISVVRFSYPPQRAFVEKEGYLAFQYPENANARSQDLEPLYHDSGQFYISRSSKFLKFNTLVLPHTIPFVLREEEVQDIDNESDWIIAEMKFNRLKLEKSTRGGYCLLSKICAYPTSLRFFSDQVPVLKEAA